MMIKKKKNEKEKGKKKENSHKIIDIIIKEFNNDLKPSIHGNSFLTLMHKMGQEFAKEKK